MHFKMSKHDECEWMLVAGKSDVCGIFEIQSTHSKLRFRFSVCIMYYKLIFAPPVSDIKQYILMVKLISLLIEAIIQN